MLQLARTRSGRSDQGSVAPQEKFGFKLCGTMHAVGRKFGQYWDVGWYEKVMPER